ncbi:MAG TPA: DUF447 domain-containing protein, partial [Candidatus Lokiarchaeia archaeon]|nr:DUF447 domain-containing protein [Candidatus Lokiarchaeia archaeon]
MDWLRLLLQQTMQDNAHVEEEEPLIVPFHNLKGIAFPADTLLECILVTAAGDQSPPNAAPMGVKLSYREYLLVQPFTNTDTYGNLSAFPYATANFTTNPLLYAQCALRGWSKGPGEPELEADNYFAWSDFPVPSLKEAPLSLKCTVDTTVEDVVVRSRGFMLLAIQAAAILQPLLPIVNRADNLALEAVVHATRVKISTDEGDAEGAKDLLTLIARYEKFVKEHASEDSLAWRAIDIVGDFL